MHPPSSLFLLAAALLCCALDAAAQAHGHGPEAHETHGKPYAGFTGRDIKALSPRELAGLAEGHGLGMALAAELNGYPGPRHVLDLADELALTAPQRAAVQAAFDAMDTKARALGEEVIALERELDRAFADRTVTPAKLDELVDAIGKRRARLRAVHLAAHLEVADVLSAEQRARYDRARGYAE